MDNPVFALESEKDEGKKAEASEFWTRKGQEQCPSPTRPVSEGSGIAMILVNAGSLAIQLMFSEECTQDQNASQKSNNGYRTKIEASHKRRASRLMVCNLLVVSLGVLCVLSAYDMLRYIESSMVKLGGMGTMALAVNYATAVVCLLLLPSLLVRRLGLKWTMVTTIFGFVPYFAAHFYPLYYTLIPAAIVMGLGSGIMETIANCAVTELALAYAALYKLDSRVVLNKFFSAFVMIILTSRIWGNIATSLLLKSHSVSKESGNCLCGAKYCTMCDAIQPHRTSPNASLNHTTQPQLQDDGAFDGTIYIIYGIGVGVTLLSGTLVAVALQRLPKRRGSIANQYVYEYLMSTVGVMKDRRMVCLIPATISLGMMEAFLSGDFTEAFVNCSLGLQYIGPVVICYGFVAAVTSAISGFLSNVFGRFAVFLCALLLNIALLAVMIIWTPTQSNHVIFYVIAGGWGAADALWRTQLFALFGDIFKKNLEAAFSCLEIWEAVGLMLGYAAHGILCMRSKLWVVMIVVSFGLIGCGKVEIGEMRKRREIALSKTLVT